MNNSNNSTAFHQVSAGEKKFLVSKSTVTEMKEAEDKPNRKVPGAIDAFRYEIGKVVDMNTVVALPSNYVDANNPGPVLHFDADGNQVDAPAEVDEAVKASA